MLLRLQWRPSFIFSARGYGREGALSSRARSQELEEILRQLEDAWPVSSRPASQWSTSVTDGSHGKMDEFLYPNSTSILLGSDPTRWKLFKSFFIIVIELNSITKYYLLMSGLFFMSHSSQPFVYKQYNHPDSKIKNKYIFLNEKEQNV